jgi:hypothetical protein
MLWQTKHQPCANWPFNQDFPPSNTQHQPSLPLELPDPWQGPRTYAEDFYTGGDFNAQDQLNGVSPSSLTPVHDALVETLFSNILQDDGPPSGVPKTEAAVVNVDVTDEALPASSPPPSSPVEVRSSRSDVDDYQLSNVRGIHEEHEEPDNILDHLYRDADSLSQDEQQSLSMYHISCHGFTKSFSFSDLCLVI